MCPGLIVSLVQTTVIALEVSTWMEVSVRLVQTTITATLGPLIVQLVPATQRLRCIKPSALVAQAAFGTLQNTTAQSALRITTWI